MPGSWRPEGPCEWGLAFYLKAIEILPIVLPIKTSCKSLVTEFPDSLDLLSMSAAATVATAEATTMAAETTTMKAASAESAETT